MIKRVVQIDNRETLIVEDNSSWSESFEEELDVKVVKEHKERVKIV